jgi:transcriptional regulator with XRE-family HTH domain
MITSVTTAATGRRLRSLRTAAGLTQEELAERAGISARALRALETGTAKRARPDTVDRIARVLGLTDDDKQDLLKRWRQDAQTVTYQSLYTRHDAERTELSRLVELQVRALRTVSKYTWEQVDADRHNVESSNNRTVEVVAAGVDRIWQTTTFNYQTADVDRLTVVEPQNATVGGTRHFPSIGVVAIELLFGRELPVGSLYAYGYGFDFRGVITERTPPFSGALDASAGPGSALTLGVKFTAPELPINIRRVQQPKVDIPLQVTGSVELSELGTATIVVDSTIPGAYGIVWDWPGKASAAASWPN